MWPSLAINRDGQLSLSLSLSLSLFLFFSFSFLRLQSNFAHLPRTNSITHCLSCTSNFVCMYIFIIHKSLICSPTLHAYGGVLYPKVIQLFIYTIGFSWTSYIKPILTGGNERRTIFTLNLFGLTTRENSFLLKYTPLFTGHTCKGFRELVAGYYVVFLPLS